MREGSSEAAFDVYECLHVQVHLKDSVIACLQQEIAVERSNIITKTRFNR